MNWNFVITFFVGIAIYLVVLGIIAIVKKSRVKKKNKNENKDKNEEKPKD